MKRTLIFLAMIISFGSLMSQVPNPRLLFLRVVNTDGSSLSDTTGISFEAVFHGVTRNHRAHDFSVTQGGGDVYARVQLGNFNVSWENGDEISINILRQNPFSSSGYVTITIPDGYTSIWWGCPPKWGDFPGEAVPLYPFVLEVLTDSVQTDILRNSEKTNLLTEHQNVLITPSDTEGVFSLGPPPTGYRWEPSECTLGLKDFILKYNILADDKGFLKPALCSTLEFKLVKDSHCGKGLR